MLLTGATGFIGSQVLRCLAKSPVNIRATIRPGQRLPEEVSAKVESVVETGDLFSEQPPWYEELCRDVDTVFHLAWYVEAGQYLTSDKNLHCLEGTLNLARGAVAGGARRFVGAGTCFEYDTSQGHLSIETPLKPASLYAASKAALYETLSHYLPAHNVDFQWCRFFYLYGEGEDSRRLVPYIRKQLEAGSKAELTSGNQIRDFLDVREAATQFVEAGLGNKVGPLNICSGKPTTVRELAETVADEYGRRNLLVFGARADNYTDPPFVVGVR